MKPDPGTRILPAHIEETVQAIAQLHADHYEQSTPLQKVIDRLTARAGRPEFVAALTLIVVAWMALNVTLVGLGRKALDVPPFFWMQGVIGLGALYMTLLILATQRREDELASRREQLSLELGILSEQKAAKIIQLLEELRRDLPMLRNREDHEATQMAVPVDPQAVFEAIKQRPSDSASATSALPAED
ncbi:MAG: DUF1003 domain-containing protein [Caldimonas sp.]